MTWIVNTLALLPWWGWLIVYLIIIGSAAAWMEERSKRRLEETGLQPDYSGRGAALNLLGAILFGIIIAIEVSAAP